MKKIQPVTIWDGGQNLEAKILNAYAVNVTLGQSATFYYSLSSEKEDGNLGNQLRDGNLNLTGEEYLLWNTDDFAWDYVAQKLNLTITGDFIPPAPPTPEQETEGNI